MADIEAQSQLIDGYSSMATRDNRYDTQNSLLTDGYSSLEIFAITGFAASEGLLIDGYNSSADFTKHFESQKPPFAGSGGGGTPTTTYYKMRGYYVAGLVYEVYVVADAPSSTPPSGHILANVVVIDTWTI
ncbi:hypothetical protein UFOVP1290_67 [uncultured Caudovirales phage]|uniref:Uncharacterized protein n=1 Tax=uncultured Caudovirales phage TaxID=2100421 RepID=A0A6J5RQJ7_9CAUD|nr:hypothetical protein UFOVP1290_67 [uncultured Caudovirales phage]